MPDNHVRHPRPKSSVLDRKKPSANNFWLLLLLIFSTVLLNSCATQEAPEIALRLLEPEELISGPFNGDDKLQVVASTSIVGDVVGSVGGERINLSILISRGTDPHTFQPTPGDLQTLYQADLILLNGLDLEIDLIDILGPVSELVPMISLSKGLPARSIEVAARDELIDDHAAGIDPHIWFDPTLVSQWADRTNRALKQLDPGHADEYQVNTSRYQEALATLDDWILGQTSSIPVDRRILILDHLVLGYFADRYGFKTIGALVPSFSSGAEASPRELAALSETIATLGVRSIFVGVDTNPRLASQIASDLGLDVVALYMGSLGPIGGPAETYLKMMQYNVLAIKQALSPDGIPE